MKKDIVSWFSGGVASAITCKLTIDLYGADRTRLIFIDTGNEHDDNGFCGLNDLQNIKL